MKSGSSIDYVGNELELFKHAENWKKYFSGKIGSYIHGDVLEVGAGNGVNTPFLMGAGSRLNSWTCIEPDQILASQITENTTRLTPAVQVINGIITDINAQFDTIIYIDVLEHIEQAKQEIAEIGKRLKPGGHLLILVPAYQFLYSPFDKKIGHFRRYNRKMLLDQVGINLKTIKLFYLDSLGFIASVANKLLLQKDMPSLNNILFWDRILVRLSRLSDQLVFKSFGKSLIGIFQKS
jgi:SAM-dependent methyltransferase